MRRSSIAALAALVVLAVAAIPADAKTLTRGQTTGLSINDVTQSEGDAGTTTFTFTVSLSSPALSGGVTFDIATADGTATTANGDYVARFLTGQNIPEGSSTYTF